MSQAAPALQEPSLRLNDPVRTLLRTKSHVVWSVTPETTVFRAIEIMAEKHIGCLVVLTGSYLAGIVSERDYARKVILKGRNSAQTLVRDIMSAPVMFVTPQTSLDEAMRIMSTRRVRHLPVMEGETVVGMLSIGDLLNWVLASQQQTIRHLQNYIGGQYPG